MELTPILILCLAATALNLPFGYYRAGVRKYSLRWFLAIHLPIPVIIVMRLGFGQGWRIVPLMFASAVAGQLLGGMLRTAAREPAPVATRGTSGADPGVELKDKEES